MKKTVSLILIVLVFFCMFQINVNAASIPLNSVTVDVTKEKIEPGENVTVNINFGTELGAYTFDVAYDNNIFEYVSSEGGTENDNGTRVRVTYYDSAGGTNPRSSMSVTFKAKDSITSTNPTDFSVTAEGLANNDASQEYDDITSPIKKSVTVEPNYVDYTIEFNYSGKIIFGEEKAMELITKSSMGKNYDHARIILDATTPDGGNVQLKGTDETQTEYDLIDSGWGDPSGYAIGGQNVNKVLNLRGIFDKAGEYTLTFKLIDRDNSDAVIAENTFTVTVSDTQITPPEEETPENGTEGTTEGENMTNTTEENLPTQLPKTGINLYVPVVVIMIAIMSTSLYIIMKKKNR